MLAASAAMLISCSIVTDDGSVQTNTHVVHQTNTVTIIHSESNRLDSAVDTNLMRTLAGSWMVAMESYQTTSNAISSNGDIIDTIVYVATNVFTSLSNNGTGGAYSLVFKTNGNVDYAIYDNNGIVSNTLPDQFSYQVVSNQVGTRLELIVLSSIEETRWVVPAGEAVSTLNPVTITCQVTNYISNYAAMNVYSTNMVSWTEITNTNSWTLNIFRLKTVESYSLQLDTNTMTLLLDPDTWLQSDLSKGALPTKSAYTLMENISIQSNTFTINSFKYFESAADNHYILKRIY